MTIHDIVAACPSVGILLHEAEAYKIPRKRHEAYHHLKQQLGQYVGAYAVYTADQDLHSSQAYEATMRELCRRLRI